MNELGPITAELRRVMNHTTMAGVPLVEIGEFEFGHRCDAIDAVHASLEAENAELRELVRALHYCTSSGECDGCPANSDGTARLMPDDICDTMLDCMRELRVEVDG